LIRSRRWRTRREGRSPRRCARSRRTTIVHDAIAIALIGGFAAILTSAQIARLRPRDAPLVIMLVGVNASAKKEARATRGRSRVKGAAAPLRRQLLSAGRSSSSMSGAIAPDAEMIKHNRKVGSAAVPSTPSKPRSSAQNRTVLSDTAGVWQTRSI